MEVIRSDVLVVGGGVAGMRAALEAQRRGAAVVVALKGCVGSSGASTYRVTEAAGYGAADGRRDPTDGPAVHLDDIVHAGRGVCDPTLAEVVARRAPKTIGDLESWGVVFEKEDDSYLITQGCYGSKPRNYNLKGHGTQIVQSIIRQLRGTPIRYVEHCLVAELVIEDGRCVGAAAVLRDGTSVLFLVGATVLATGGAGRLFERSLNPSDVTGDGYALAYRAGAELINMEFMQCGFGVVHPALSILNSWIWSVHPPLYDRDRNEVLKGFLPPGLSADACMHAKASHYPFSSESPSRYMEIAVQNALTQGRGSENGGVFLDLREVRVPDSAKRGSSTLLQDMWAITDQWLRSRGLDYRERPLEIACFAHAINGGLRIDERACSTVEGLLAAGEAAGGPHGADRLGGNMLATCMVFGEIAGRSATEISTEHPEAQTVSSAVRQAERCLESRLRSTGKHSASSLKTRLQRCTWQNLLVVRSGEKLRCCLDTTREIREQAKTGVRLDGEIFAPFELDNMLLVSEVMSEAALKRTESRGSHYRQDYPSNGGDSWRSPTVSRAPEIRRREQP